MEQTRISPIDENPIVKDGPGKAPAPQDTRDAPSDEKIGSEAQNDADDRDLDDNEPRN